MKKLLKRKNNHGDVFVFIAICLISILGLIFIYSASNYNAKKTYGDSFYFVKKQAIGIVIGIIVFFAVNLFDYVKLKKCRWYFCVVTVVLLCLVFVPGIGVSNYGARRWIGIGGITVQPSELAKFGYIVFCASCLDKNVKKSINILNILPVIILGIIYCVLIISEPNMSICVCFAMLMLSFVFVSGISLKFFPIIVVPAILTGVFLIFAEPYRLNRLSAFLNPWASPKGEGYQLLQSLYALGSGGLFGVGLFNSRQKLSFLPFSESDFILSVIGEEVGFFGLVVLFGIFFFVIYRGLSIARNARDLFGFYLSVGITMIFAVQVIINVLVVSGSIPPTGLPLPLMSSGNTSIIVFFTEFGFLYNVSANKVGLLTKG